MKEYEKYCSILKEKYPCRVELHAHTSPASKCADFAPEEVVEKYKNLGYDAIVITNHFPGGFDQLPKDVFFEQYFGDFDKACAHGEKLGIKVFLGSELRFENDDFCPDNDYLLYGCTKDDLLKIYDMMNMNFRDFAVQFKQQRYALFQAHPLRSGLKFCDSSLVDGYEAFNMHPGHNASIALAARLADKNSKTVIAGTDFHHSNHEGCAAVRFKKLPEDEIELAKMLKENDFLIELEKRILIP